MLPPPSMPSAMNSPNSTTTVTLNGEGQLPQEQGLCRTLVRPSRRRVSPDAHMNYAWRDLNRVKYERYSEGPALTVRHIDGTTSTVERHAVLRTRALEAQLDVYLECEAFITFDCCDLGDDCPYLHLVFVGPRARLYQKASTYRRKAQEKHERLLLLESHRMNSRVMVDKAEPLPPSPPPRLSNNGMGFSSNAAATRRVFYRNPYSTTDPIVFVCIPAVTQDE